MATTLNIEGRFWDDQDWAFQHYPELVVKYAAQWIAVYNREVVASGQDVGQVEEQAAHKTGQPKENIAVIFIEAGDQIL
jgi:hypothetical protein